LAAKSSVTKLTHQDDMFVQRDYSEALDRQPVALVAAGLEASGSRHAKLVGTAAHLVISSLDLRRPVTRSVVEKTRDRLVKEGAIPADLAESIDTEGILAFLETRLGALACDKRNTVWQEWPFTFGLPARESSDPAAPRTQDGRQRTEDRGRPVDPRAAANPQSAIRNPQSDEIIVVQGVIDLLVQTPEGMLVIDFKTDHVCGEEVRARAEAYRGQLEMYARAAAAIRRDKVLEKWLYFFTPRQAVQV